MKFEIVSEVTDIDQIATGHGIRDLVRLNEVHGEGRWRKLKERSRQASQWADPQRGDSLVRGARHREEGVQG